MKQNTWFAEQLADHGVHSIYLEGHRPAHMPCLEIKRLDWRHAAEQAKALGMRLIALWAAEGGVQETAQGFYAYMAFTHTEQRHVLLRTQLADATTELPSVSDHFIAAARMERVLADMFGIGIEGLVDQRPWLRHEHWPDDAHPLRRSFDRATRMPRKHGEYPFIGSGSAGVYEIPVGPVHAGIIEPGHFRFLAVGEQILNMEERLGYVHKGIEKAMEQRTADEGVSLAARVSGDTAVGHAWAFCRACEHAAGLDIPPRASHLRAVLCERERIANHIGDIGAICNDVAFVFMQVQMQRLREEIARLHQALFGHRLLMDTILPGGIACDLDAEGVQRLVAQTVEIAAEVERLREIYDDHPSIQQRVIGSGIVSIEEARDIGLLGFAGRASGHWPDERIEEAYPPYDQLSVKVPEGRNGDVAARVWARFEEIANSAAMIIRLLETLPDGSWRADWVAPDPGVSGFAVIEAWRGEIACWIRFGENGRIDRYFVRDPSVINWLGLELAVRDVPVPDFPLNNKSFNCSYSGNDV